ncbi:acyl-CoA dehydrogenase family protein [Novosphingobium pentaromativorans]|uniref:Acyl-CoA dehydrogenase n=1 Tax=Novosphingobium pentaromativorans US6-1 TaxID=1088721 RepID=G6E7Z3_9SPHN|nr:acyl-CoA dehydrogenase family protein [Novosphingobium pentaromativorans]AIT81489.1 hypothetical protein JI59_17775 [Novosphingobium pentaromativorans US6-1]EHJ62636.1 hypothetical protein NSU_0464 [Novosphingobium pentaromativorans US6-1]
MDIDLSEDQVMLQDSTRRFVEDRASIAMLRKLVEEKRDMPLDAWRMAAEQGWTALLIPEEFGGFSESAQGLVDAAIVAEELGRVIYPGPFLSSAVAAYAINDAGSSGQKAHWLPKLASGEAVVAWAMARRGGGGRIAGGGVRAAREGENLRLGGHAAYVLDAQIADAILVSVAGDDGATQVLLTADTPGITITPLDTLDVGRRIAHIDFADVVVSTEALLGEIGAAGEAVERQFQVALVLQCAETIGVVERALEICLEYTNERLVFGRPVASYQAIKHRLADHATQLMGMKAAVAHAAKAVKDQASDAAIAASIAKSQCGKWGTEIVRDCMHMHGGIGMTWEHDIHFYGRRAVSNEALLGTPAAHHERLCRLAGL